MSSSSSIPPVSSMLALSPSWPCRAASASSSMAAISGVGKISVSASLLMPQNSVGRILGLGARKRQ
eukprot:CAMPEP_0202414780 /NCGR_PEP_ID=MMETSP1128-20130828/33919_1 /ASSEMBLY_ACC=CAM_ASM_000463 /TAXON_ID=3047 /ORGANISM="Dunaliella tertiolecta, Strain CCMP1320" /LENGTH=65 /DNA_ID=CAMNT_0049021273 /DNA_START=10 /DNA_END=204 /DNA_ORIENTATION=+